MISYLKKMLTNVINYFIIPNDDNIYSDYYDINFNEYMV
jgi:hypothetical protein|uniref:Uncharacterized protein n=1 Tax=viral metagenome TaxID=1070528 RepID=A0A6C0HW80_9ZZZZ